jgi:hypothetical protein
LAGSINYKLVLAYGNNIWPKENLIISMNGGSTPTISLFNDTGLSYSWIWGYTITGALPTSHSVLSDLKANVATTISMIAFAIGTSTI